MSRWFRWYEGSTEDAKFRVVARLSRVTVRDVIALWAFILEDAAHLSHRGVCNRNEDFMAATLDFEDGVVERILAAMEDTGLISVGHGSITVCNFGKRQFESDADTTAAERQRRKRARDAGVSNTPVTRDSRTPETETETETEKEGKRATRAGKPDDLSAIRERLTGVLDAETADALIEHRRKLKRPLTPHAAKLLAEKFAQLPDPRAGPNAMIANGWQGFEPQWLENRGTSNGNRPSSELADAIDGLRQFGRSGH